MSKNFNLAKATFDDVDEYEPLAAIGFLMGEFGIAHREAEIIVYGEAMPKNKPTGRDCHYCGCPAVGYDFFDEPVCAGCGG